MADPSGKRSSGAVKWFSPHRGFGFIAPDDGGDDLFVHQTAIRSEGFRTLSEGQPVEFGVDIGDDGRPKAVDVAALGRSQRGGGRGRGSYDIRARGGFRGGTRGRGGYGGYTGSGGACYNCGRMGHLARECYQSSGTSGGGVIGYGRRRYGGGGGGGDGDGGYGRRRYGGDGGGGGAEGGGGGSRGGGACYSCGEEGHFARDCYNYDQK